MGIGLATLALHPLEPHSSTMASSRSAACLTLGALLLACSHAKPSCTTPGLPLLDDLGRKHGTDKSTTNHAFLPIYSRTLESIRQSATRVMEVGVFYGSSILMWRDYFTKAEVVGVDPFAGLLGHGVRFPEPRKFLERWQQGKAGERIKLIEADQADTSHLERTVRELQPGGAFDMIIDDGSHKHRDQQQTMGYLLPLLKPGGVYIIEDIHTSLQPRYDQPKLGNKTTLMMVERWQGGLPIRSPFMNEEQQAYANAWLAGCLRVVPPNSRSTLSQTCVCWKRESPRVRAVQEVKASPRGSMRSRLYDADEVIMKAGAAKALPKADRGCKSDRSVPRVFQGR